MTETPRRTTIRAAWAIPVGIVLLGLGLRLYRLDYQSLWYDELFSVAFSRMSWQEMHAFLVKDIVHPPLYFYVLHVWSSLFGAGPVQARLVSVIFGTLSVLALYALAKYLFDHRTAVISALLLAVSQIGIRYSQEARPYSQVLLLVVCANYLFLRALRSKSSLDWWLFVGCAALLVTTHYYGVFAIASFAVFASIYRKRYSLPVARYVGGAVAVSAVLAAWMASGVLQQALRSPKTALGPSSQHWYTVFTIVNEFNNGRAGGFTASAPWWTFALGGVLFSWPALLASRRMIGRQPEGPQQDADRENTVCLFVLSSLPVLFALGAGMIFNFQAVRYVAYCAAPYYVLAARGIGTLNSAALRRTFVCLVLIYSAYELRANYFIRYKEDYRSAVAYPAGHSRPGDCFVTIPVEAQTVAWAWSIYEPAAPALRNSSIDSVLSSSSCGRVWLIAVLKRNPHKTRWAEETKARLETQYSRIESQSYFWIDVGLYERRNQQSAGSAIQKSTAEY